MHTPQGLIASPAWHSIVAYDPANATAVQSIMVHAHCLHATCTRSTGGLIGPNVPRLKRGHGLPGRGPCERWIHMYDFDMSFAVSKKRIVPHGTGSSYVTALRPTRSAASFSDTL